jgi:hypothetical protein
MRNKMGILGNLTKKILRKEKSVEREGAFENLIKEGSSEKKVG